MRTLEQIIQNTKDRWDEDFEKQQQQLSEIEDDLNKSMEKYGITITDTTTDNGDCLCDSVGERHQPEGFDDEGADVHRSGTQSANRKMATEER